MDVNRRIGAFLLANAGGRVDLTAPDVTVGIMVSQASAYTFTRKINGVGGLPVGSAGKIIALLSAGIDSPVASWRMMRRGATIVGVHFSGRPQSGDQSERLVVEIGEVLRRSGGLGRIYVVAFGDLQKEISLLTPPDLRVLMYRRLMIKVAERIARVERAKALVTGESLGQVASQTLENIAAVDEAATLPVLRPLIGSDKQEIIAEAKTIGTYELSIVEHDDCCTLFMPRTPETHAKLPAVLSAWDLLDVERMVEDALETLSWQDFPGTSYRSPRPWHTPVGETVWDVARSTPSGSRSDLPAHS
jgi:thiamine biosynthesis protein ThiI